MASNTPTPLSIPQALQRALAQHQAGNLSEAEGIYRQVLAVQSDHPGAVNADLKLTHFSSERRLKSDTPPLHPPTV